MMALTLRLDDTETAVLETIKEDLGVATASAAIRQMIMTYAAKQERITALMNLHAEERRQANELKQEMLKYLQTQETLAKMVGHIPNPDTLAALQAPATDYIRYNTFSDFLQEVANEDA